MAGKNRVKQQANKQAKRDMERLDRVAESERKHVSHYKLDWFKPTPKQMDICESYYSNMLTAVQGSSGTGKSTATIWLALNDIKERRYEKIVFCKTPAELGDDKIGFLTGSAKEKLTMHFDSMRGIFHTFMTKEKLIMEEANDNIEFTIPNFIAGRTIDNAIFILDEAQLLSVGTTKLLLERAGRNTKVVVLGDKGQTYACKHRDDGFTDFVKRITDVLEENDGTLVRGPVVPGFGYVEMGADENMRSDLSKAIVNLYEA